MKKILLFIACLLFLLEGCRQASKQQTTDNYSISEDILLDSAVTRIKIDNFDTNSVLKYSEVFEEVNFVRLETTDNCLIGRVDRIVATADKFIILDSSIAHMVFVFNRDGSFANRIGTRGEGPQDYDSPDDIAYDKYKDELLVLCHNNKSILRFKLDGTFVGKITVEWWISSIFVVDDNAYLLFFNNRIQPNRKRNDHNIFVINEDGKILEKLFPYQKETGEHSPPRPKFSYYNNEIIFSQYYFNTVYSMENNEIKPKYYLDFGKRGIPMSVFVNNKSTELWKIIKDREYVYNMASFETSSHVITQFSYKGFIFDFFYSKPSGNTRTSCVYINDMHHLSPNRSFFFMSDDLLISPVNPESFVVNKALIQKSKNNKKDMNEVMYDEMFPLLSSLTIDKKLKDNFMEILKTTRITVTDEEIDFVNSIEADENPVLLIAKPKEF